MCQAYEHPGMQHLSKIEGASAVVAWHTSMDIQATRMTNDEVRLFIGGEEVPHSIPEMVTFHLASMGEVEARRQIEICFDIIME